MSYLPSFKAARARLQWYTGEAGCSLTASLKLTKASAKLPALYCAAAAELALRARPKLQEQCLAPRILRLITGLQVEQAFATLWCLADTCLLCPDHTRRQPTMAPRSGLPAAFTHVLRKSVDTFEEMSQQGVEQRTACCF